MSLTTNHAERILILGTNPLSWKIAELIANMPHDYGIVGVLHDDYNTGGVLPRSRIAKAGNGFADVNGNGANGAPSNGNGSKQRFPVLGPIERLDNAIKDLRPERIVVPYSENAKLPAHVLLRSRVAGVAVEDGNEFYERLQKKLAIEELPPSTVIFSKEFEKPRYVRALRRAFNIATAALALILTAPLLVLIAIIIKLDSEGPVFFVQEREGYRRRPFPMFKFRTMEPGFDDEPGWSRDLNSRVTRVGKWLRRFHLDELPQFVNVLRGEMDVVGPRPEMACNVNAMSEAIPYFSLRAMIRPGITGWAQLKHGYSVSQIEVAEKIRYDLYYIKHRSLWFDIKIIFSTLNLILFRFHVT